MLRRQWADLRRDDGMTLIEVSVALVIISIILSSFAGFLVTMVKAQRVAEGRVKATEIGQQAVENMRALPWDVLGYYPAEVAGATTMCSPTTASPLVELPTPAGPADARAPKGTAQTVTVNTVTYSVSTCVTWRDDPTDGLGIADPDGTTDKKDIKVHVSWGTRSLTVDGQRAPTASEVAPKSGASTFTATATAAPTSVNLNASGNTTAPVEFTANILGVVASGTVSWTDASGTVRSQAMTSGPGANQWHWTMPAGTGPFNPMPTTFQVAVVGPTGEQAANAVSVTFGNGAAGSLTVTSVTAAPNSIDTVSGVSQQAFTITAQGSETISGGTVYWQDRAGATVSAAMTVSGDTATKTFASGTGNLPDGADIFRVALSGPGGTATSETTVTFVPPVIVPVHLVSATMTPVICSKKSDRVMRDSVLSVVVDGLVASGDTVKASFDDSLPHQNVSLTLASTNGTLRTYVTTVAEGWKLTKDDLTVSVTATRSADNTQASNTYAFPATIGSGNTCP